MVGSIISGVRLIRTEMFWILLSRLGETRRQPRSSFASSQAIKRTAVCSACAHEKKLTEYQLGRLTGTIKKLRKVSLSTVDRELSKARRLFNIAVDEGWLLKSPFTKAVSRNLIHDAAETPDPIKTRELTDEEALRVMKALDTPERRHTLPVFIAAMDTGARKSSLLDYLRWKDVNFADEIITLSLQRPRQEHQAKALAGADD